ncbi:MAG: pyrroline-5-carboxylate reductase [Acidimicrobiaceae bacterium]|jgi:pyrroline-5-carboxylate reductase|nr:pyrroline-5-carboxylate reductase [Acidimicrobiaceae bacterium]
MGEALLGGLVADGWAAAGDLHVAEPDPARRDALLDAVPGLSVGPDPVGGVDTLVAVKPDVVPAVCEALAGLGATRVLSIAAGVRLATFESILGAGVPVVRAMPNTPSLVGAGAAAIAPGAAAGPDDLDWAAGILSAVGTVQVVDESLLDAVTGLSGSGPAYVFLLAEALMDAGEAAGLPRDTAVALTEQTLLGAATLLRQSDDPPSTLRQNVTSKGGTTAAGLAVFEEGGFRDLVRDVVAAAAERSRELGGG